MCLILFAYRKHPDYPLILIANRDEYYARPARNAHWWADSDIFAGRDLEAGGTWLGVNRRGFLAAVTNVREPGDMNPAKKTRGDLTREYLAGNCGPEAYLGQVQEHDQDYAGFNLLLGDTQGLWHYSNRERVIRPLEAGVYGISNGHFDESWPKLSSGREELGAILDGPIDTAQLMEILTDHRIPEDHELPSTGVTIDIERMLSSRFIRSQDYGTRACSVVTVDKEQLLHFDEQNYIDAEHRGKLVRESFAITRD